MAKKDWISIIIVSAIVTLMLIVSQCIVDPLLVILTFVIVMCLFLLSVRK